MNVIYPAREILLPEPPRMSNTDSSTDGDLKPLLAQLLGKMDVVLSEVSEVKVVQKLIFGEIAEVKAEQKLQAGRVARLEGKVDVMGSWLQSVDQRFVGLMAPINPPRKPAA